ncbi:MAG: ankyrin repeat domain-containing protein [Opitutales bacterium]|nr:ankyrin repeat domain-containing protein [Opitutales bacterium]
MQLNKTIINNIKTCLFTIILMFFLGCNDSSLSRQIEMNFSNSLNQHLVMAAFEGKTIESFLEKGADPNALGKDGTTPLFWAVYGNQFNSFKTLLKYGANPNFSRLEGRSILALCAANPNSSFLEEALDNGGEPNTPYHRSHITPINDAIIFQNYNNLEILVESGADINHQTTFTETPLLECMYSANYKAAVYLLQNGADPAIICKGGYSFLDKVNDSFVGEDTPAYSWKQKTIKWLIDHGYEVKGVNK